MAIISISQAQGIYTDKLEAIYREKITPTTFLRSFFAPKVSNTKYVSIAVRRSSEFKAEDVQQTGMQASLLLNLLQVLFKPRRVLRPEHHEASMP